MATHRSITQRLQKAKSKDVKIEVIAEWLDDWEREQNGILNSLREAADNADTMRGTIALSGLRTVTEKKFDALFNITGVLGIRHRCEISTHNWQKYQSSAIEKARRSLVAQRWADVRNVATAISDLGGRYFPYAKKLLTDGVSSGII